MIRHVNYKTMILPLRVPIHQLNAATDDARARRRMAVAVGEVEEREREREGGNVPHFLLFPPERGKTTQQFVGKTIH